MSPSRTTPIATSSSPPAAPLSFTNFRFRRPQFPPWTARAQNTPATQVHAPTTPAADAGSPGRSGNHEMSNDELEDLNGHVDSDFGDDGFDADTYHEDDDLHISDRGDGDGNAAQQGEDEEGGIEEVPMETDEVPFDATTLGLKEIGNLASWTVSSCKPGCGVEALRDEDTGCFWQSDGPQPHALNIHFSRLVSIRRIRLYLDFELDESYTPTRITILAGTGYHDLLVVDELKWDQPKGWKDVNLNNVGGGDDGRTLRAFLVQVRVIENHQNGKDTHVRGLKIFAKDDRARGGLGSMEQLVGGKETVRNDPAGGIDRGYLIEPDWMGEPELR